MQKTNKFGSNKIKTFFRTVVKSSISPEYYNDVLKAPASFSWKYFFAFQLAFTLLLAIPLVIFLVRFNPIDFVNRTTRLYPEELEIIFEDGQLKINQDLPYSIGEIITFESDENIKGIKEVRKYGSRIIATESTIYVIEKEGDPEIKAYPLSQSQEKITINKKIINRLKNRIIHLPFFKYKLYLPIIIVLSLLVMYLGISLGRIITIFIYSLILLLLTKLFMEKKGLTLSKLIQINIHAITPIAIVSYLSPRLIGFNFLKGWILFFVFLTWSLFLINKTSLFPRSKTKPKKKKRSS